MARWEIKNVGMKGVAMTVPENVVKTSELGLLSQEEADVLKKGISLRTQCAPRICARLLPRNCLKSWVGRRTVLMYCCLSLLRVIIVLLLLPAYCKTGLACRKIVSVWIFQWVVVGVCML